MNDAEDHFSAIAPEYARGRIRYPEDLFRFLAAQCPKHDSAWDCATGSGQAAHNLAKSFSRVIATDISKELLALAAAHPRISYRAAPAEQSGAESHSIDLVTVAQAIHWFDLPRFWLELKRVLKPDGVFAFWGYNWPRVEPGIDGVLENFKAVLASSWPERSALLHDGYTSIHAPLREISSPAFETTVNWEVEDYLAHLRSWSATRYYRERTGEDPIEKFRPHFSEAWCGDSVAVRWPIILRVYRNE